MNDNSFQRTVHWTPRERQRERPLKISSLEFKQDPASLSVHETTWTSILRSSTFHPPLIRRLLPHLRLFYLPFTSSCALCVKSWFGSELQGCNLEATRDPIRETNRQSTHSTLPPPASHTLVTAAGSCLPGTRHAACLSRFSRDPQIRPNVAAWEDGRGLGANKNF